MSELELRPAWRRDDTGIEADAIAFWRRLGALPRNVSPQNRAKELCVSQGTFEEDRTVVDFEVGKDIGIGGGESKLRIFGGLRYAHYTSDFTAKGEGGYGIGYYGPCLICFKATSSFSVRADHSFDGVGPRLGLTAQHPLFGGFFLTGSVSGSLLWGDHQVRLSAIGQTLNTRAKFSDDDLVSNAEGEIGVGMPFLARGTLIVGARWEGWFDQAEFSTYTLELSDPCACREGSFTGSLDRNNWGPFVRFNLPLGPPP